MLLDSKEESELHWEPFAVLTDKETLSSDSWRKHSDALFLQKTRGTFLLKIKEIKNSANLNSKHKLRTNKRK